MITFKCVLFFNVPRSDAVFFNLHQHASPVEYMFKIDLNCNCIAVSYISVFWFLHAMNSMTFF